MAKLSDYLHTAAASEYLGVAQKSLRKWAARGDVKMHRHAVNGYCFFATSCDRLPGSSLQVLTCPVGLHKSSRQTERNMGINNSSSQTSLEEKLGWEQARALSGTSNTPGADTVAPDFPRSQLLASWEERKIQTLTS
jgi:hypothetical protein